jgi:hypothetical protein
VVTGPQDGQLEPTTLPAVPITLPQAPLGQHDDVGQQDDVGQHPEPGVAQVGAQALVQTGWYVVTGSR